MKQRKKTTNNHQQSWFHTPQPTDDSLFQMPNTLKSGVTHIDGAMVVVLSNSCVVVLANSQIPTALMAMPNTIIIKHGDPHAAEYRPPLFQYHHNELGTGA